MVNRRFPTKIPYGFEMVDSARRASPAQRRIGRPHIWKNHGELSPMQSLAIYRG
jgi:hypothetical protein